MSLLSSFFPSVPVIALTATATVHMQKEIIMSLGLCEPIVITVNPDRPNIYFASCPRKNTGDDKLCEILQPLALDLNRQRQSFPLTLIYGTLETISVTSIFAKHLEMINMTLQVHLLVPRTDCLVSFMLITQNTREKGWLLSWQMGDQN